MKESQIVQKPDAKSTKARCVATIIEHTMNQKLLLGDPIDRMRSRVKGILGTTHHIITVCHFIRPILKIVRPDIKTQTTDCGPFRTNNGHIFPVV